MVAVFGALTIAELAGALPRSGGIFAYLLESFGPVPAFMFGWTELTVVRASALGATATIFADYLGYFVPMTPAQVRYVAAGAIILIGMINYIGVQRAAAVMTFATVAKYVAVMALGALAFTVSSGGASHFTPAWGSGLQLSLLATALIPVMWTYDGWADLSFMGGEVKNPQRTLPLALILGTLCVMLVYLVVNIGFMYLLPLPQMAQSKLIAATAAEHIPLFGGRGRRHHCGGRDCVDVQRIERLDDDRATHIFRDGGARVVLSRRCARFAAISESIRRDLAGDSFGRRLRSPE